MTKRLLTFLAACFYYSGLVSLAYWWKRRKPYLTILAYHQAAEGGELRDHLLYLRQHYRVTPLDAALDELYTHPPQKIRKNRPGFLKSLFLPRPPTLRDVLCEDTSSPVVSPRDGGSGQGLAAPDNPACDDF